MLPGAAPSPSPTQRYLLLDVMRAFAAFMMVQGHTVDGLLSPEIYNTHGPFHYVWLFARGLTAPIFLFGSGFAYVLANTAKRVDGRLPASLLRRRVKWIGGLFLLGVLMHAPVPIRSLLPTLSATEWVLFLRVDVLRLMAVALLLLLGLFLVCRSTHALLAGSLLLAGAFALLSPWMYSVPWSTMMPVWLSTFLTKESGSYFPLFPFASYLFAGSATGAAYLVVIRHHHERTLLLRYLVAGAACILIGALWQEYGLRGFGFADSDPVFVVLRIGWVLVLWGVIGYAIQHVRRLPKLIPLAGQHTLFIYVSHVTFIFGCSWYPGLRLLTGGATLGLIPVLCIIVLLLVVCMALVVLLQRIRREHPALYRRTPYVALALMALVFVIF
jgi:uncharacterized membrane protein